MPMVDFIVNHGPIPLVTRLVANLVSTLHKLQIKPHSMTQHSLPAFSLTGKTALVTGASSGIGQAQSLALAKAGASVVLLGRREDALISTQASIEAINANAFVLPVDLHDRQIFPEVAKAALGFTGAVDIVINAAGVNYREPAEKITPETWDATLNLNLSVPFFLSREFVPGMQSRGWGRIINIAAPGFFPTGLTAPVFEQSELTEKLASQTAIGRNGELSDLDGVTVFLASPASNYITGQIIYVDGGFTAK